MLSGLHNIGLGTLSGYAETSVMLKDVDVQNEASMANLKACQDWLNWRKNKTGFLPQTMERDLSVLGKLRADWNEENVSVEVAKQWTGWVNGVDGAVIAEQYVVKSALQKALGDNFDGWESQISALSGTVGSINSDRYVGRPGPTIYSVGGEDLRIEWNQSRIESVPALSSFMQYNRPGHLSSQLSGISPFFELNPWLTRNANPGIPEAPFQLPYDIADKICRMNEPLATPIFDMGGSLSVTQTYNAPAVWPGGEIAPRTFQTSAWIWNRQFDHGDDEAWPWPHYFQYNVVPQQYGGTWWLGRRSWQSLQALSARYNGTSPVWSQVRSISAGTGMPFKQDNLFYKPTQYPMNLNNGTVYDLDEVENDWAPMNFTYGSDFMRIWTDTLIAELTDAAHVKGRNEAGGAHDDGQDIRALERSLNECAVLARQLNPGTPIIENTVGGWTITTVDGGVSSTVTDTWSGGVQTLLLNNFVPYGGPMADACAGQHKWAKMATKRYRNTDTVTEYTDSWCQGGSIRASSLSTVVWDFGMGEAVLSSDAEPQVWYCMNFVTRKCQCETWSDEQGRKISFGVGRLTDGFKMAIEIGFVRADTTRARRENGQLVADPNGNLLVAFQGRDRYLRDVNAMAENLQTKMGNLWEYPLVPTYADMGDPDQLLSWRGISFAQVEFMPPYFCCVWIPWAKRFEIVQAYETKWPGQKEEGQ